MVQILIFVLCILQHAIGKNDVKFRVEKLNFVWSKASAQLIDQPARLDKLMYNLIKFDDIYLNVKQNQHHGKTPSEKQLTEIDRKLETVLQRYDLEDTIHAFRMKYKYDDSKSNKEGGRSKRTGSNFEDFRIQTIWESAKDDNSFTLIELDDLFYDLLEHEQKSQEYKNLLKQISEWQKKHNHIAKDHGDTTDDEHINFVKMAKQMNVELENNFVELAARVKRIKANPFKQTKVRLLWEKALKKEGLVANELDVIKTELRHFERHLEKIDYYRAQTRDAEEFERGPGKSDVTGVGGGGLAAELREQHDKMLRKIKKLEHYLNKKIVTAEHSEL